MNMMRSTSTTSTSGVMLMAACILADSPSRITWLPLLERHLGVRRYDLRHLGFRYFEQAVHQLRRRPVHLDMESFDLAREVVEGHDGRDRDENSKGRRDERFSNTARNHRHPTGPCGGDASKRIDDANHCAEEADKRRRGADRGQEPETPL